jgi:hypothetical protein
MTFFELGTRNQAPNPYKKKCTQQMIVSDLASQIKEMVWTLSISRPKYHLGKKVLQQGDEHLFSGNRTLDSYIDCQCNKNELHASHAGNAILARQKILL